MRKVVIASLFFSLQAIAQQTFTLGEFKIDYGLKDSVFAFAENIDLHFYLTNQSQAVGLLHNSSRIKVVKMEGDSEKILINAYMPMQLVPIPGENKGPKMWCGTGASEFRTPKKLTREDKENEKLKRQGLTPVDPGRSINSAITINHYYFANEKTVLYDFGEELGTRCLWALRPGQYKLYLTPVVSLEKVASTKELCFTIKGIAPEEETMFADFKKSLLYHHRLDWKAYRNRSLDGDSIYYPFSQKDSSIYWFFDRYPQGAFNKILFRKVFDSDDNNPKQCAYCSMSLLDWLKDRNYDFPISDHSLTIAMRNLTLMERYHFCQGEDYMKKWFAAMDIKDPPLSDRVKKIKASFDSFK